MLRKKKSPAVSFAYVLLKHGPTQRQKCIKINASGASTKEIFCWEAVLAKIAAGVQNAILEIFFCIFKKKTTAKLFF